jgi:hypothetical protein
MDENDGEEREEGRWSALVGWCCELGHHMSRIRTRGWPCASSVSVMACSGKAYNDGRVAYPTIENIQKKICKKNIKKNIRDSTMLTRVTRCRCAHPRREGHTLWRETLRRERRLELGTRKERRAQRRREGTGRPRW